jgi:hypothetical protein
MVGSAVLQTATGKLGTLYIIQAFLSVRDHDSLPSLSLSLPCRPERRTHPSTQALIHTNNDARPGVGTMDTCGFSPRPAERTDDSARSHASF